MTNDIDAYDEVYDEAEQAEIVERRTRNAEIASSRSRIFQGTPEEAERLIDPNKECEECGELIPVARQRFNPIVKYCVECQEMFDELARRKKFLTCTEPERLFG